MNSYFTCVSDVFRRFKNAGKTFSAEEFKNDLLAGLGEEFIRFEFSDMLLEMFVADITQNLTFNSNGNKLRFISSKKSASGEGLAYRVMNSNYITLSNSFMQLLGQCVPNQDEIYQAYIPAHSSSDHLNQMQLLSMLELFGLAACEVTSGANMEIYIRINDPVKLRRLSDGKYTNKLLMEIRRRHKSAQDIMMHFLQKQLSSEQRWDIIENYFLGKEDYVEQCLRE